VSQNLEELMKIIIENSHERNFYVFVFLKKKKRLTLFLSNPAVICFLCLLRRGEMSSLIFPSLDLKVMKAIVNLQAGI